MFEKISENVWKLNVDSNVYLIDKREKILIDTGPREYKEEVERALKRICEPEDINKVIFTHLHYDHSGNADLFKNARFFASEQEIKDMEENAAGVLFYPEIINMFADIKLEPVKDDGLIKVIEVPGHTKGSIALWLEEEKVLFSGDTLFFNGIGRTDLPTSDAAKMEESLKRIRGIPYEILAPGHDY